MKIKLTKEQQDAIEWAYPMKMNKVLKQRSQDEYYPVMLKKDATTGEFSIVKEGQVSRQAFELLMKYFTHPF